MYAQIVKFDGPRSTELVTASERAGTERIFPAVSADPEIRAGHVATLVLRQPNGAEVVVVVADTEDLLERGNEIIMQSELLPGEDPALLPGADSAETYEVVHAYGRDFAPLGATS
jgi:hypothetical protein